MLRIIQNNSAAGAKSYYTTADYYTEGQELQGIWHGEGAARLGLSGVVQKEQWDALCDNQHPLTNEKLTLRTKTDRRIGYDFNFHVPKSVSILFSQTQDGAILDAFRSSVDETMHEMEAELKTRVRKNGQNQDRTTGNMVWGSFVHFTSRPVDNVPDPHLHAHCFVFNTTWDEHENSWKAGQFADLKRDAPYFEAVFQSKFASRLQSLGLEVERTHTGWGLSGVDRSTVEKFSRRTLEIEREARKRGIRDADRKSELGAKTRGKKESNLPMDQLRAEWNSWLKPDELATFNGMSDQLRDGKPVLCNPANAKISVEKAIEHCFERKSVVPERMLLAASIKRGIGVASRDLVEHEFKKQDLVVAERDGRWMATTKAVLAEERKMVAFARHGRGTQNRFANEQHVFTRDWLNAGQKKAVGHVLRSRDRVILIRGAAGVGKTTMMQEAVEAIEKCGTHVFTFAPSADASRGTLREAGFENAETVSRLLLDEKLQEQVRGQAIWIDEAGLLGTVTTSKVFDLANRLDARVILSGDRWQHGSVERGAALRLLELEAGLVPAEIKEIQRQKGDYKQAVQALSEGRTEEGFRGLDRLGWVREVAVEERHLMLARDYAAAIDAGKTALVVSPTHFEGERISAAIRQRLQDLGHVSKKERTIRRLEKVDMTEEEKSDATSYLPQYIVEYHQNAKGHRKGERLTVGNADVPFDQSARFQAFVPKDIQLASGDLIRVTQNGKTADGKHTLNNRTQYRVDGFDDRGNIVLANGWTIDRNFGHLAHGYVVTSVASQGKTVDRVFVGQSADSFGASSQEQFYVSASRAREQVTIYTDDKEQLLSAINRSDDRLTATELLSPSLSKDRAEAVRRQDRLAVAEVPPTPIQERRELEYDR
jgi:conjugative relaxase-like TrwC/TraI family protein